MAPRILCLLYSRDSSPGEVGRVLEAMGYALDLCVPRAGHRLPRDPKRHVASVMFGGPQSANDIERFGYMRRIADWVEAVLREDRPYLGICLGAQVLARVLGARVAPHAQGLYEVGYFPLMPTPAGRGLIEEGLHVYHWHHEGFELPAGARLLATGEIFPNQAYRYGRKAFGLQFHPEVAAAMRRRWTSEAARELARPGAQSAAEQEAKGARHETRMHAWLARFLAYWLTEAGA